MNYFFLCLLFSCLQHVCCNSEEDNLENLEDMIEMEYMETNEMEQAPRDPKALSADVACIPADAPPIHHSSKNHAICDDRGCITPGGSPYNGTVNTTFSGRTCKVWSTTPTPKYGGHNYCRGDPSYVYCYTTDPNRLYEYCEIPRCLALTKGEI